MGTLGKYFAYRWMTGGGGGDGGDNPLVYFMILLGGMMLGLIAVLYAFQFVYNVVRGVMLLAPHLATTLVTLVLLTVYVTLVTPYSREHVDEAINDRLFHTIGAAGVLTALLFATSLYLTDLFTADPALLASIPVLGFVGVYLYSTYMIDRYVGAMDDGGPLRLSVLTPVMFVIVVGVFQLPVNPILSTVVGVAALIGPFSISMATIYYRHPSGLTSLSEGPEDAPQTSGMNAPGTDD